MPNITKKNQYIYKNGQYYAVGSDVEANVENPTNPVELKNLKIDENFFKILQKLDCKDLPTIDLDMATQDDLASVFGKAFRSGLQVFIPLAYYENHRVLYVSAVLSESEIVTLGQLVMIYESDEYSTQMSSVEVHSLTPNSDENINHVLETLEIDGTNYRVSTVNTKSIQDGLGLVAFVNESDPTDGIASYQFYNTHDLPSGGAPDVSCRTRIMAMELNEGNHAVGDVFKTQTMELNPLQQLFVGVYYMLKAGNVWEQSMVVPCLFDSVDLTTFTLVFKAMVFEYTLTVVPTSATEGYAQIEITGTAF